MQLKYGFISADDHVMEHPDVWTSRMSRAKWGDRIPHLERQADGSDAWIVAGRHVPLPDFCRAEGAPKTRTGEPRRWEEVPPALYSAPHRLQAMDLDRIDCSVLYPSVGGLAGENLGRIEDLDLQAACARAYNDWLIEEWAPVSPRFVPQCVVPLWPMERTCAEIKRAVANGHKGVVYPASPMELRDVPHINEPAYDPLWSVCQELNVPICFHAGASPKIRLDPGEALTGPLAAAFSSIARSVSSIAVVANFLFSRVLYRFPNLKVVFADGSIGWAAYELEYADYQSAADGLQAEGYALKPSELFQRQCYLTCSYDRVSLRVRRYVGVANILWSSHFPLPTSTWPDTGEKIAAAFNIPAEERDRILWRNAAALYALS